MIYHQQGEALQTSERATNFIARNDHGLIDYYGVSAAKGVSDTPKMRDGYIIRPWSNVVSLSLSTYPSSVMIPAGTTIQIYGVRG